MSNINTSLSYYFQAKTTDNNGQCCTDINVGLKNLFEPFNEEKPRLTAIQRMLTSEIEEGYPDLLAHTSVFGTQELWWWILLACRLDDALFGIKANYIYPVFPVLDIQEVKTESTYNIAETQQSAKGNAIGSVVELN